MAASQAAADATKAARRTVRAALLLLAGLLSLRARGWTAASLLRSALIPDTHCTLLICLEASLQVNCKSACVLGGRDPCHTNNVHLSAVRLSARQAPAASAVERSSLCGRLTRAPGRLRLAGAVTPPMLRPTDSGNASVARVEVGPAAGTCTAAASAAMAALQAASLHPGHAGHHDFILLRHSVNSRLCSADCTSAVTTTQPLSNAKIHLQHLPCRSRGCG